MRVGFTDNSGSNQEVELSHTIYQEAADARLTVPQFLNLRYPTNADRDGTAFEQFMSSAGLFMQADSQYGIRPPNLDQIINGQATMNAGALVREANPASRILFPAVLLEAIENKLKTDFGGYVGQFDSMIAISDSINGARFEQPVLNYSKPEAARSQGISQLALPSTMLSITVSDVARKIPTFSLGMEVSKEALQASTLDLVALAIARQGEYERAGRVDEYLLSFLQGDTDLGMAALAQTKANTLDTGISTAGALTHKAWMKWLRANWRKRHIDWVITDIDGALAIENRTGKPTINTDDPNSPRIDALAGVANPSWQPVKIFLVDASMNWPANTIMGLDSRYAIRRVRNSQAEYSAVEEFVLKKSEAMRFDFGEICYRLFDEAFEVLSLTT